MAIIRWNPWNISSFLNDEEWDFPTIPAISRIAGQGLNIYETDNSLVAEIALPGIHEDKIDVSIDKGIVRVSAAETESQEEKSNRKYYMSSMSSAFNYSFRLPEGISDNQEPKAVLEKGVLKLTFQKPKVVAPKKIKVISQNSGKKEIETK
jgi:HSP20 family protein